MDLSKLSPNQQLTVGGAAAMLILAFFPWYGVSNLVSWSVILVLEAQDRSPVSSPADIVFYLVGSGAVLIILRFIDRHGGVNSSRRIWLFLAIVAAGVAAWGAYQNRLDNS